MYILYLYMYICNIKNTCFKVKFHNLKLTSQKNRKV